MDCSRVRGLIDDYIDDMLPQAERAQLLEHARVCPKCAEELKRAKALKRALAGFDDDIAVPLAAQAAWRGAVKKEAGKRRFVRRFRAVGAVAAAFVVMIGTTLVMRGAGMLEPQRAAKENRGAETAAVYYTGERAASLPLSAPAAAALETDGEALILEEDAAYDAGDLALAAFEEAPAEETMAKAAGTDEAADSEGEDALLVLSALREIYTDSFDTAHAQVQDLAEEYGGYIVSDAVRSGEGTRSAELIAAIPRDDLDAFLAALDYLGTVTQAELNAEDVSLNYFDAQGRLDALAAERDRLQALVSEAQDAEEMAALNAQLEDVFARIDALEHDSRSWESALELAQVRILLREGEPGAVGALPDEQLGARMQGGFRGSLQSLKRFFGDMAVSLAVLAPVAAIVLPVVIAVRVLAVVLVHRRRKTTDEE